jgi:AcrR family transcriptional regulator
MQSQSLTESQSARRERMLAVALELALAGGWDGVQMREVASRAGVALGTLYRYFPSKEHLLVSLMLDQVRGLADRLAVRPPEGADSVDRVSDVLRRANRALQAQPEVTTAMIRALVSGNTDIAPVVASVREEMRRIITDALVEEGPADEDRLLRIDLLSDVWLATVVSWISGSADVDSVVPRLRDAARVILA